DGFMNLYERVSNAAVAEATLFKSGDTKFVSDWSRDGRFLLYTAIDPKTGLDLWILPLSDRKAIPYLQTRFVETQGQFSPDGRWIAYASDESGTMEIYVRPFGLSSGPGDKSMVSSGGASQPRWRRDGKELFYFSGRKLMAVEVMPDAAFRAAAPKPFLKRRFSPSAAAPSTCFAGMSPPMESDS